MKKFIKKPIVVEAEQWFKYGDVPEANIQQYNSKGKEYCSDCGKLLKEHGTCKTLEGYHIVCPNDWIIKGIKGEFYPCKPDIFTETYIKY